MAALHRQLQQLEALAQKEGKQQAIATAGQSQVSAGQTAKLPAPTPVPTARQALVRQTSLRCLLSSYVNVKILKFLMLSKHIYL
ncbi:hypothetical protein [Microseira sp. BLCC-F43]|uniref:hypothetical protein n=1 Tax=Microseira sp. BLCC-F43 TaxID=3153602 RepID=UPI0035BC07E1